MDSLQKTRDDALTKFKLYYNGILDGIKTDERAGFDAFIQHSRDHQCPPEVSGSSLSHFKLASCLGYLHRRQAQSAALEQAGREAAHLRDHPAAGASVFSISIENLSMLYNVKRLFWIRAQLRYEQAMGVQADFGELMEECGRVCGVQTDVPFSLKRMSRAWQKMILCDASRRRDGTC